VPTNGIYLPAANSVAVATNGAGRLFIDASGVGIGTSSPVTGAQLTVAGSGLAVTGQNTAHSANSIRIGEEGSGAAQIRCYGPDASTNGSLTFTMSRSDGLNSKDVVIDSSGRLGIGTTSPTKSLEVAAGATSGNGILVTGSSSPQILLTANSSVSLSMQTDGAAGYLGTATNHPLILRTNNTERAQIDTSGRLLVGTSTARANIFRQGTTGITPFTQIESAINSYNNGLSVINNSASGFGAMLNLATSYSTSLNSNVIGSVNQQAGTINFLSNDGTNFVDCAQIRADVDGTPGANDMPGRLVFSTTADGASSPTERLRITSAGNVGIGTASPSRLLHLSSASDVYMQVDGGSITSLFGTDNTGTYVGQQGAYALRLITNASERARLDSSGRLLVGTSSTSSVGLLLVQGNSASSTGGAVVSLQTGATSPGSGSLLGEIRFGDSSSNNGAYITAEADAAWTSGSSQATRLVFSTTAAGASSPTERLRINSSGAILYGTTTKNITSPNNPGFEILSQTTGGLGLYSNTTGDNVTSVVFQNPNGRVGFIDINANSVVYSTSSDYRLKENVTAITDGITRLQQLKPTRFNFITNPDQTVDGFLAHEVQAIVPEAITGEKDAVDEEGNPVCQGIDPSKLVPLLTAALQEAIGRIETLEAEVSTLKGA
jgi:hypothetical protein